MRMRLLLGILLVAGVYLAPFRDDASRYFNEPSSQEINNKIRQE